MLSLYTYQHLPFPYARIVVCRPPRADVPQQRRNRFRWASRRKTLRISSGAGRCRPRTWSQGRGKRRYGLQDPRCETPDPRSDLRKGQHLRQSNLGARRAMSHESRFGSATIRTCTRLHYGAAWHRVNARFRQVIFARKDSRPISTSAVVRSR